VIHFDHLKAIAAWMDMGSCYQKLWSWVMIGLSHETTIASVSGIPLVTNASFYITPNVPAQI
jgi:hypothetical protein